MHRTEIEGIRLLVIRKREKKGRNRNSGIFLLFAMGSAGILDTPISAARHVVLSGSTKAADGELMERLLQGVEPKEGNIRHNRSHKNTFVGFLLFFSSLSLFRRHRLLVVVIPTAVSQGGGAAWHCSHSTLLAQPYLGGEAWLGEGSGGLWKHRQIHIHA